MEKILHPFQTDRCDRPGGGVVVYVRDTLTCRRRPDLEIRGLEAVCVENIKKIQESPYRRIL